METTHPLNIRTHTYTGGYTHMFKLPHWSSEKQESNRDVRAKKGGLSEM